jgi:multiple sugar transport system permease protein
LSAGIRFGLGPPENPVGEPPAAIAEERRRKRPQGSSVDRSEERWAYAFLAPWFCGLALLFAVPLVYAVYISLTNESLFKIGRFTGLANYEAILHDKLFFQALGVTAKWILISTPLLLVTGLAVALLLNQKLPGMNGFRTLLYIPAVLSGVAVTVLWLLLLNGEAGAVNQFLRALGWADPPNWFEDTFWAMPALAIMSVWGVGGGAVIFLAGLQNIPPHLYEAASIDGAGPVQKFRHVTLPMLSPTLFFVVLNLVIDGLLVFGPIFIVSGGAYSGGPNDSLLFYMLYLYRKGFLEGQLGYASALAWILTLIGVGMVWLTLKFERRFVFYESEAPGA